MIPKGKKIQSSKTIHTGMGASGKPIVDKTVNTIHPKSFDKSEERSLNGIPKGNQNFVNIKELKKKMTSKFPNSMITEVLKKESDQIPLENLYSKLQTWQIIIDNEKRNAER